jgi:hypothetical protein
MPFSFFVLSSSQAVNVLLAPGGPIDNFIAIGIEGFFKLLALR